MTKRILLLLCLLAPLSYAGYRWHVQSESLRRQQALVAAGEALERALQTKVSLYDFSGEEMPLDELVGRLERRCGVVIRLDAAKLAEIGVAEQTPARVPAVGFRSATPCG